MTFTLRKKMFSTGGGGSSVVGGWVFKVAEVAGVVCISSNTAVERMD